MRRNLSCYWAFNCFLTPSLVLLGVSAKSRCLGKLSHPSLLNRQAQTVVFFSKIAVTIKSPILHFAPTWTHNTPHCPKKEQNYHHSARRNHSYPSRWLLLTKNCCLVPRCTWYCHITSCNWKRVVHSSFVSQKLVQIAVNGLYRTSDPPGMFINGVWTWMILRRVSLLASGTLGAHFGSGSMYFQFSECPISRYFWNIILVVNELPTTN